MILAKRVRDPGRQERRVWTARWLLGRSGSTIGRVSCRELPELTRSPCREFAALDADRRASDPGLGPPTGVSVSGCGP